MLYIAGEETGVQLSSLTWTLVFQTQQSDSTVSTTNTISKPELRNTQDFASIHTHVRDSWFSKFYDTIVETVHCWLEQRIVLFVYRPLSFYLINLHIRAYTRDYVFIERERKFGTIFRSIFFFLEISKWMIETNKKNQGIKE